MEKNYLNFLINKNECTEKESQYIHSEIEQLSSSDLKIYSVKTIVNNINIKYLNPLQKCIEKRPDIIRKFEENISNEIVTAGKNDIKRINGSENLFRMVIDDGLYSKMIIYSIDEKEIWVKKCIHSFYERTHEIESEINQIKKVYPKILTTTESINYILKYNCSLVRYGDGELNLCYGRNIGFQNYSYKLQERLIEILKHGSNENLLVSIPEFNSIHNNAMFNNEITFWEHYWLKMYNKINVFFVHEFYGNTDVSRNTVFYENELEDIKRIWDKRNVVFVMGDKGRFEIKPILFDNILSFEVILIPPVNAFEKYNEIIKSCLIHDKSKLFLVSAGPTATVLVFDLMKNGYQALDIGHLPNCYDQYTGKISSPESMPFILC